MHSIRITVQFDDNGLDHLYIDADKLYLMTLASLVATVRDVPPHAFATLRGRFVPLQATCRQARIHPGDTMFVYGFVLNAPNTACIEEPEEEEPAEAADDVAESPPAVETIPESTQPSKPPRRRSSRQRTSKVEAFAINPFGATGDAGSSSSHDAALDDESDHDRSDGEEGDEARVLPCAARVVSDTSSNDGEATPPRLATPPRRRRRKSAQVSSSDSSSTSEVAPYAISPFGSVPVPPSVSSRPQVLVPPLPVPSPASSGRGSRKSSVSGGSHVSAQNSPRSSLAGSHQSSPRASALRQSPRNSALGGMGSIRSDCDGAEVPRSRRQSLGDRKVRLFLPEGDATTTDGAATVVGPRDSFALPEGGVSAAAAEQTADSTAAPPDAPATSNAPEEAASTPLAVVPRRPPVRTTRRQTVTKWRAQPLAGGGGSASPQGADNSPAEESAPPTSPSEPECRSGWLKRVSRGVLAGIALRDRWVVADASGVRLQSTSADDPRAPRFTWGQVPCVVLAKPCLPPNAIDEVGLLSTLPAFLILHRSSAAGEAGAPKSKHPQKQSILPWRRSGSAPETPGGSRKDKGPVRATHDAFLVYWEAAEVATPGVHFEVLLTPTSEEADSWARSIANFTRVRGTGFPVPGVFPTAPGSPATPAIGSPSAMLSFSGSNTSFDAFIGTPHPAHYPFPIVAYAPLAAAVRRVDRALLPLTPWGDQLRVAQHADALNNLASWVSGVAGDTSVTTAGSVLMSTPVWVTPGWASPLPLAVGGEDLRPAALVITPRVLLLVLPPRLPGSTASPRERAASPDRGRRLRKGPPSRPGSRNVSATRKAPARRASSGGAAADGRLCGTVVAMRPRDVSGAVAYTGLKGTFCISGLASWVSAAPPLRGAPPDVTTVNARSVTILLRARHTFAVLDAISHVVTAAAPPSSDDGKAMPAGLLNKTDAPCPTAPASFPRPPCCMTALSARSGAPPPPDPEVHPPPLALHGFKPTYEPLPPAPPHDCAAVAALDGHTSGFSVSDWSNATRPSRVIPLVRAILLSCLQGVADCPSSSSGQSDVSTEVMQALACSASSDTSVPLAHLLSPDATVALLSSAVWRVAVSDSGRGGARK